MDDHLDEPKGGYPPEELRGRTHPRYPHMTLYDAELLARRIETMNERIAKKADEERASLLLQAVEEKASLEYQDAEEKASLEGQAQKKSLFNIMASVCNQLLPKSRYNDDRCDGDDVFHAKPTSTNSASSAKLVTQLVSALKKGISPFVTVKVDGWFVEVTYQRSGIRIKQSNGTVLQGLDSLLTSAELPPLEEREWIIFHCELVAASGEQAHEGGFGAVQNAIASFKLHPAEYSKLKLVPFEIKCVKLKSKPTICGSRITVPEQAALMKEIFSQCRNVQHLEVVVDTPLELSPEERGNVRDDAFLNARAQAYIDSLRARASEKGQEGYVITFPENKEAQGVRKDTGWDEFNKLRYKNAFKVKPHVTLTLSVDKDGYPSPATVCLRDSVGRKLARVYIGDDQVTHGVLVRYNEDDKIQVTAHGVLPHIRSRGYYLHGMFRFIKAAPEGAELSDASYVYLEGANHHTRLCAEVKRREFSY